MKNMAHLIIGLILIIIGWLTMMRIFNPRITHHYTIEVVVNEDLEKLHVLTFSIDGDEPITIQWIKSKFEYNANDRMIIIDMKSITEAEKRKIIDERKKPATK